MNVIFSNTLKISVLGIIMPSIFAGCGIFGKEKLDLPPPTLPQFQPKQIEERARGITIAKSAPYNCKILGEIEGNDNAQNTSGATKELLRMSAINDLKNEASYVASKGRRTIIKITQEEVLCKGSVNGVRRSMSCIYTLPKSVKDVSLTSYKIKAQIYDCGEKARIL